MIQPMSPRWPLWVATGATLHLWPMRAIRWLQYHNMSPTRRSVDRSREKVENWKSYPVMVGVFCMNHEIRIPIFHNQYKCWWKNFSLPETNSKRASSPPNKMASRQGSASHHQFSGANLLLVSGTRVFLPLHPLFQPSFLMIFRALWSWSQMTHQIFGHQFGCFQK